MSAVQRIRVLASCLVLLAGFAPRGLAAQPETPAALTAEQKTALASLDALIVRFDGLLARVDDPKVRTDTQAVLDRLKAQRKALDEKYDQSRYEELRLDVNTESQRVAIWLAPLRTPPRPAPKAPAR
jgi:hypothetical protein